MSQERPQPTEPQTDWRDQLGAAAGEVKNRAQELINEGNAHDLVIQQEGREVIHVPLTIAAVIGAVTVIAAPLLAVVATVAALMARVRPRIEHRAG